jgi:transposase InsO family protein
MAPAIAALDIHDDPEFGYQFIPDELPARGITAGRNRVSRLCSQHRIYSAHAKKRGAQRKPEPPVHDDLVQREFTAPAPNQLSLTDITEHPTAEGKLYLCAIKDACSKRIVGYSIGDRVGRAAPRARRVGALRYRLLKGRRPLGACTCLALYKDGFQA